MTTSAISSTISSWRRLGALSGIIRRVRAHPVLNPLLLRLIWAERKRLPVDPHHRSHLIEALEWLIRAQDATPDGGFARGYSIGWHPYWRRRGWQPSYPETTGYIIPTLYMTKDLLTDEDLSRRAERAARWETEIQLPSGAVQGGAIGQGRTPSVFNTGQVLFGWLNALEETQDPAFAAATSLACDFLLDALDSDGFWRRANSQFARPDATLYNARAAWGLAEAGVRLAKPKYLDGASMNLRSVAKMQLENGWFPNCCLSDPKRPLLHTLAYTIRGLLEGGRLLEDSDLIRSASVAAHRLMDSVDAEGWMPGRFSETWAPAVRWSCLTGQAQAANIWLRLFSITGDDQWLGPVASVLRFLKSTQDRKSRNPGVRGGIRGSFPVGGEYGRYEILNWATKFFVDALFRHGLALKGLDALRASDQPLA